MIDQRSARFRIVILLLMMAPFAFARSHHTNNSQQGKPGVFDYYLLTLSWSPEFCHSHSDKPECQSGHHGFVVHGLWPQYNDGYPEHCSDAPGLKDPSEMADLMPDAGLVEHEWTTHGTCSGLDAEAYFKLLRQAFTSIKLPNRYAAPGADFSASPADIKADFLHDNPNFTAGEMTVSCGNNFLTAVSFCMTKGLQPTACQNLRDCRANVVKVPKIP